LPWFYRRPFSQSTQLKGDVMKHIDARGQLVRHRTWAGRSVSIATAFLTLAVMLLGIPTPARSQGGSAGTLAGVVLDSSGGVLPGVVVVATSRQTGFSQQAVTGTSGEWRLSSLPVGTYEIAFELEGF
jgi:hypothetical protein